jgi:hypothetical protein
MMVQPDTGPALGGGALIGAASVLLLLSDGKIAGISGIAAFLLGRPKPGTGWRIAFLVGLLAGPPLLAALAGHVAGITIAATWPTLVVAGLLVGYGTRLGSGCTSGHGVSGLGRLSPRSIAAVLTFLAMAAATVFVMRHVLSHVS